ncbi:hypothetical protein Tco_0143659 [Tanacetum coccineum]
MHGCSLIRHFMMASLTLQGMKVCGLKCWFKKMEQVFEICKCAEDDKVKFAISPGAREAMMTTEILPATLNPKVGTELWTLNLKGDDIEATTTIFPRNGLDVS